MQRTWALNHIPKDWQNPKQTGGQNIIGIHQEYDPDTQKLGKRQYTVMCIRCGRAIVSYSPGRYQFCKECKL